MTLKKSHTLTSEEELATLTENVGETSSLLTVLMTFLLTIVILLGLEYFYQIPSRYFAREEKVKIDIASVTLSGSKPIASVCTLEYAPVCGNDLQTYSNACIARGAGVSIAYDGACEGTSPLPQTGSSDLIQGDDTTHTGAGVSGEPVSTPHPVMSTPTQDIAPITFDTGSYQIYSNTSLGYTLALPKSAYFHGYGARDGANHSLAISLTDSGTDTFEGAEVRIYYYKTEPTDIMAGATRVKTASGTIIIDAGNITNPKIQRIVDTIRMSAK